MSFEITAVRYGTLHSRKSELYYRYGAYGDADAAQVMDFYFYVLRDGDEVTLVDTGYRPETAAPRGRECLVPPPEALARLGIEPGHVSRLVITHMHWDHIGNVELFGGAELFVPAAELEFWSQPLARNPQMWAHVDGDDVAVLERIWREGGVVETRGEQEIAPGLRVVTVGGHSPGQQVLVVETAGGPVVLASDAVHLYEELELERPFSVIISLPQMIEAYALIKRLRADGADVVPGHDPLVTERYPSLGGDADGLGYRIA